MKMDYRPWDPANPQSVCAKKQKYRRRKPAKPEECRSEYCDLRVGDQCGYKDFTGCARPCRPWPKCDFDAVRHVAPAPMQAQKKLSNSEKLARRQELYDLGLSDREIAELTGVTVVAMQQWRSKHGLVPGKGNARRFEALRASPELKAPALTA